MKTICITGESGFLGYHLKSYYAKKCNVVKLGKNYLDNLILANDCDFLIHAAGVNRDPDPNFVYSENIQITKKLIDKLEELNLKINIKFISTIRINDNSLYSKSKIECENLLKDYCDRNKTTLEVYYLPNLFGTNGKPYYNSVVNTFCYNACNGITSNVSNDTIRLCHVLDAIRVINNEVADYEYTEITISELHRVVLKLRDPNYQPVSEFENRLKEVMLYYKSKKLKVLILGHNGMLGSMVKKYFKTLNIDVITTDLKYPNESFFNFVKDFNGDFIINCVGAIPQKTKDFKINSDLPIWLVNNVNCYVIHPGTDCELDAYDYGISKKIASEYIKLYAKNTKIIMTSIIGHENNTKYSLLEWFLNQEKEVDGYSKALWNGITTLEWAKQCYDLMLNWKNRKKFTVIGSDTVSKYQLLNIFKRVYNKDIHINMVDKGHDRSLKVDTLVKSIEDQLIEMKTFLAE